MSNFPRLWENLLNSETGMPVVVKSIQRIMDDHYHPDSVSMHEEFELVYIQELERGAFAERPAAYQTADAACA